MAEVKSKIRAINEMLTGKEITCTELTQQYLDAIDKSNGDLNAYVNVTADTALKAAKAVDDKIAKGEELPLLAGVPMTLKDNISTSGIETTCCSKPSQPQPCCRRFVRRRSIGSRRQHCRVWHGLGHRRFYKTACKLLRHSRLKAYIRQCV